MNDIIENYKSVFLNWSDFKGRARRREYWLFTLANIIVAILLAVVDGVIFKSAGSGPLGGLYSLVALVPGLAVSFRRLHDIGKSAWWLLLILIPFFGAIVLIYFMVKDSEPENIYGPNPKQIA